MRQILLATGASSGFGRMIATELATNGHVVYASMRGTAGKNAAAAKEVVREAHDRQVSLLTIDLDVQDENSVNAAVREIVAEHKRIDVVVHNAGYMVYGALEAFTPERLAELYDINVLGTQRVNRAVLPHMRRAKAGLLVWVSSSSVAGGIPPLLGPYFAAKAGMDQLAVCYAHEFAPFGIDTTIVVPGAYTKGTNHFIHAGKPDDEGRAAEYDKEWPKDFAKQVQAALAATDPADSDPGEIGRAVAAIVGAPVGKRPFRTVIDPADDGSAVSFPVIDRIREQFLLRIGLPARLSALRTGCVAA